MNTGLNKSLADQRKAELERISLELIKKNEELEATNRALFLLRNIDKIVLTSISDPETVVKQIARSLVGDGGYKLAAIYVRNTVKQSLEPHAAEIEGEQEVSKELQKHILASSISQRNSASVIARSTRDLFISSSDHLYEIMQPHLHPDDASDIQSKLKIKSIYVCPLYTRDQVLGAMVLGLPDERNKLSFFDYDLMERLTTSVGIAVDDTLLYAKSLKDTNRLRVANRRLKELDHQKDEFISMASHQLRTPLTSIKGYISMLEDGDAGSLNNSQREYLEYAYSGSVRMVNLINDLLNVSRMQAGKFLIDKEFADIEFIVREEVQNLQAHANTKNIHLKYIAPKKKIPDISLDINKTRQVIMNFIDNAIYYTPKGSINVSLEIIEDDIELRVKDTGIGVPKAAKKQLFSKFFRAPNAMTLRPDGTGLGLYLAKRVIEDQNGTIIFESEEGKGSTFGFRLPMNSKQGGSHAANK